jgi:hypothetical protein
MGKTPDRFPGTREEDEVQLVPGATSPSTNGAFSYKTGVGFEFYEEGSIKTLFGTGITEGSHENLDTLVHNLSEDSYEEVVYSSGKVSNVINWTDSGKTTKIREVALTRTSGKVSQIDLIQYDVSGSEKVRMTGVITRTSGRVSNISWTETVAP